MSWEVDDLEALRDIRAQLAIIADVLTNTTSHSGDETKMMAEKIFIGRMAIPGYKPEDVATIARDSIKVAFYFYKVLDEEATRLIADAEKS